MRWLFTILVLAACGDDASSTGDDGPTGPGPGSDDEVGQVTGVDTALPPLPPLVNVRGFLRDDSTEITFDPIDGARDYRVYPLPADGDITVGNDGEVIVKDAIYRCAGDREAPSPNVDGVVNEGSWVSTLVANQMVGGHMRTLSEATLGYVYTEPGPGRVPVYALGEADMADDNTCYFARWAQSRVKHYTTSTSERTALLADYARDDGIAFYVPAEASPETRPLYVDDADAGARFYLVDGAEAARHPGKAVAFPVLASAAPGTQPLMRVFYANNCGRSHDELAVGAERFARAYQQGDKLPSWTVAWSGYTEKTMLVVEALDQGCPYQGHFSPTSMGSVTTHLGNEAFVHPAYQTIDELRAGSPTKQVFLNGQHAAGNRPRAIARSFVQVTPRPSPAMDHFATFSSADPPEAFTPIPCGAPDGNCYQTWRLQSPTWDLTFHNIESGPTPGSGLFTYGAAFGQLWVNYADVAADTNGRVRLTAREKATMSDDAYVHVTMEVDAISTGRRYPQLLISDRDAPIQYTLPQGRTLVIQPRGETTAWWDFPVDYELQVCKHRNWDVNDQCPVYDLHKLATAAGNRLAPHAELGDAITADRGVRFDVYASTNRVYLFLDKQPYGCAILPADAAPTGPVTVTYGDVLYHSAVDHVFAYHAAHLQTDTRRHFDNLGFSSGVAAPAWDETRLPCVGAITP